jgi:hypothetical protein
LKGNPEEMECESEHQEVHKEDAIVKLVKGWKKQNPEEMECEAEHLEVHKEDAILKPVKGQKKWHKGWHLSAG